MPHPDHFYILGCVTVPILFSSAIYSGSRSREVHPAIHELPQFGLSAFSPLLITAKVLIPKSIGQGIDVAG